MWWLILCVSVTGQWHLIKHHSVFLFEVVLQCVFKHLLGRVSKAGYPLMWWAWRDQPSTEEEDNVPPAWLLAGFLVLLLFFVCSAFRLELKHQISCGLTLDGLQSQMTKYAKVSLHCQPLILGCWSPWNCASPFFVIDLFICIYPIWVRFYGDHNIYAIWFW